MAFIAIGINIGAAPVELLEKVSLPPHELPAWLARLSTLAGGGVVLSTCNRTEVYSEADDPETGIERLKEFLSLLAGREGQAQRNGSPVADGGHQQLADSLSRHVYTMTGDDVARHLFKVTAGLHSMALGEAQVAGQVADALKTAGDAGAVQHRVSRLFHGALRASRRIREKTGLGRDRISVPSIAVHLIERSIGDLRNRSALIVGAGETGELVARALRTAGIGRLTVASRRAERAEALASELGGSAVPFGYREYALAEADVLVACTASPEKPVVSLAAVENAMRARPARHLFIMDAGMPRDVDPHAAVVAGVTLRDLQGLEAISAEHRASRQSAAAVAAGLIEQEVIRFKERITGVDAEPVIRTLGERADALRQAEFDRASKRLQGLSPDQLQVVEALSRSLVSKLLADPIAYLRAEPEAADAVLDAFDLAPASDDESGRA